MSVPADRLAALSPEKRALLAQRLGQGAAPAAPTQPRIAIVAAACRLPGGADSPQAFWRLLVEGRDAVTPVPPERWDGEALFSAEADAPLRVRSRHGAFLDGVDRFDAAFFGISPREAAAMDPQQRLLLELAWEALDAGGLPAERLAGSAGGVFVGAHSHSSDWWLRQLAQRGGLETHSATGSAHSILANRLSYVLDLRGPSMTVDTACSSSLVAVHLACQSLRSGECDLALAAGVNLMLGPAASFAFSRLQILSPNGRCRSFDAAADGIVRGEGAVLLVLKRLADAQRDGDPVLALIAGSAVNQDGASNGLTAPSGPAQEAVVARALAQAGVAPARVGLVETHGTGTPLGDPVEAEALARTLGTPDAAPRCWLGALKTNIGHLEGAAGIAGLLKAALCLREGQVPPNLHFTAPNPHLRLDGTRLAIPTTLQPWPAGTAPRVAGVSSFGFGGTNAHAVLEEYRAPAAEPAPPAAADDWIAVSARDRAALDATLRASADALRAADAATLPDLLFTARQRRSHHALRVAVHGHSAEELAQRLEARIGQPATPAEPGAKTAWVFSGQGGLWAGAARELYDTEAAFRDALDDVAARFATRAGWDLRPPLLDATQGERLQATEVAQPALFALQVALAAWWRAQGLVPDAVVGHSVGEVAAAHAAGVLTLDDAVRVVHERSRAMQPAAGAGRMAQVECGEAELAAELASGAVDLAALNGPRSCVIAGTPQAVDTSLARLAAAGVRGRLLDLPYAFHSAQMAPFVPAIEAALAGLAPRAALRPLVSTVHGDWTDVAHGDHGAAYWGRNVREPVRFAAATLRLLEAGVRCILEIGPHPALGAGVLASAEAAGSSVTVAGSLRRGAPARAALLDSLCTLHEAGTTIARVPAPGRRVVALPAYPWQRQRHALDAPDPAALAFNALGRAPAAATGGVRCHALDWPVAAGRTPSAAVPALALASLAATLKAGAATHAAVHELAGEAGAAAAIEARAAHFARQALQALGGAAPLPRHRRLHERLLELAATPPAAGERADTDRVEPALLERCGHALADVLRGQADPLALLFPADGRASAADIYARTPSARLYNALAADAVRALVRQAGRPLRVLEIGAGTGATAARLLEALPAGGDYCFTDVAPLFVQQAEERLGAAARSQRLQARRLDIESDPATQGFAGERFDLVVATNVLHATADLHRSLVHARSLLAEGGVLMLIETVAPRAWTDLTFGLTEGWWRFTDAPLRARHALLDAGAWCRALADAGFADAQPVGAEWSAHAIHPQALLLARQGGATPAAARFAGRRFHVAADAGGFGRRVAAALQAEGAQLVDDLAADGPIEVLHTGGLDAPAAAGTTPDGLAQAFDACTAALAAVQALARRPAGGRLWLATRGAVALGASDAIAPAAAPLWGLGRSIALEWPQHWGGLVDLDPAADDTANVTALLDALAAADGEDQVAVRAGAAHVARVGARPLPARATLDLSQGSLLVTGGFGGLGPKIARWLADQGARRIVLAGRRGAPQGDATFDAALAPLRARGVELVFERVDVADLTAMAQLFERQAAAGRPVRGVVHAAASIRFQSLDTLTPADLADALRAKVQGAWVLHELLRDGLFVLFSSATALFGAKGLAAYASANAFLGALAQHRAALGLPATCVDWGAWDEIRLLGGAPQGDMARIGQRTMVDADAFGALAALVQAGVPAAMLADIDWPTACAAYQVQGRRPFLAAMEGGTPAATAAAPAEAAGIAAPADLRAELQPLDPRARLERVAGLVRAEVARVLGLAGPAAVDPARGLFEMGLDSLMAMQLRRRLAAATGLDLPATLVFNHPSVQPMAAHLLERLALAAPPEATPADAIESLSDDEVRRALQAELAAAGLLDDTGGPR